MNSQGLVYIKVDPESQKAFHQISKHTIQGWKEGKKGLLSQSVLENHWQKNYQILSYLNYLIIESERKDIKLSLFPHMVFDFGNRFTGALFFSSIVSYSCIET